LQVYKYTEAKMAVYGYTRVSTGRQAEEGESLGSQQRTIEGYAMMHGLKIDHVFVERGVSGSKKLTDRPEGAKLLAGLKPGDVVLTPKLDRMFRSALDALDVLAQLQKAGISLHMIDLGGDVTGNGISKLVFTILSAVAEAERDRIRERIRDVKTDQRSRSRYLGGKVPFGWIVGADGSLVVNEAQQIAIARMRRLQADGKSLRSIAGILSDDGHVLSHAGVKKVLFSHSFRNSKAQSARSQESREAPVTSK
jgi:DNA invertase Pin-like site-specific DNA recombinase